MSEPGPVIPAATLILLRDRAHGAPEMLLVERSSKLAFAAGALVFPGGRVEPGDYPDDGDPDGAARAAAVRETREEAGLPFAADAAERLIPFARWLPAHALPRRFDTRFYLARASDGLPEPQVDGTENVRAFWITAAGALAQVDAGRSRMIFPTRRTVERLARCANVAEALADAAAQPIRTITPWTERRADGDWLRIPDDLGYPVTAERLADAERG